MSQIRKQLLQAAAGARRTAGTGGEAGRRAGAGQKQEEEQKQKQEEEQDRSRKKNKIGAVINQKQVQEQKQ